MAAVDDTASHSLHWKGTLEGTLLCSNIWCTIEQVVAYKYVK